MGYAISAAKFRHAINIQQQTLTPNADGMGNPSVAWSNWATNVRCAVKAYTGREYWSAGQEQLKADTVFNIRYLAGITNEMQIVFDGGVYDITSCVDYNGRKKELFIMATLRTEGS